MWRNLFMLLLFCSFAGCTTIQISDANGVVSVERRFGFATIEVPSDSGIVSAKVRSVGYVSGPMGHSVGISWSEFVNSDESCRVNVWVDDGIDLDHLTRKLRSIPSVCYIRF